MATSKKALSLKVAIVGIDEYQIALDEVIDAFEQLKASAQVFQQATDRLNSVEIKVITE